MNKNVGKIDRIVRAILGIAIITFGVMNQSWWGLVGAGIMIPALLGSDPLYTLIGVDTNKG
ncbi:MAG: hypothetical protein ACJA08_000958 [Cyclobacteriaceae bacterium]|jgi:hypothetical protein